MREFHVKVSKTTHEEYDALSEYEITSSFPFSPEADKPLKPRRVSNKKLRVLHRKLDKLQESSGLSTLEWKRRLAGAPDKVISK